MLFSDSLHSLTDSRLCLLCVVCVQPEEHTQLLADVGLYACIIFNTEWLFEFLTFGYNEFFGDSWYLADTAVNFMNWGSYFRDIKFLPKPYSDFFPNIAFLRMLRFLKPLGKVPFLFPSKVVVKTVAASMQSMGPVISLVAFALFFFGVAGIYIFGKAGEMYFRCGVALEPHDAMKYYNPDGYKFALDRGMQVQNCTVDMDRYHEFLSMRGKKVLGTELPNEDEPLIKNLSQAIETMASFDSNTSTSKYSSPGKSRLWSKRRTDKGGAIGIKVQHFSEETKEYDTRDTTFNIIKKQKLECHEQGYVLTERAEETYVVNGTEMTVGEFVLSDAFVGRYQWLGQPTGGEKHRRRSLFQKMFRRSEEAPTEEGGAAGEVVGVEHDTTEVHGGGGHIGGFANFRDVKCIVAVPVKICKYVSFLKKILLVGWNVPTNPPSLSAQRRQVLGARRRRADAAARHVGRTAIDYTSAS